MTILERIEALSSEQTLAMKNHDDELPHQCLTNPALARTQRHVLALIQYAARMGFDGSYHKVELARGDRFEDDTIAKHGTIACVVPFGSSIGR